MRCPRSFMLVAAALAACGQDRADPPPEATAPAAEGESRPEAKPPTRPARPDGPTGTIKGVVKFTGTAPEMPKLRTGADPACARTEKFAETVVVNGNGTLRDVLVRVKPGTVPGWVPDGRVQVDQKECVYRPRVQGGVIGQTLEVRNGDQTLHNVHLKEMQLSRRQAHRSISNRPQPAGAAPIEARLDAVDVVQLKCDAHAWMTAYVVLSDQPYFSVSGDDGAFTIDSVPAGAIELEAWHALYGVKTAKVTVEAGKTAEIELTFDAAEAPGESG